MIERNEGPEGVIEASLQASIKAMVAVKEKFGKERGITGTMPCPCCAGGTLHYAVSGYNGHTRGRCTTPGCAVWLE